jgi:hypothetical protein
MTAPLAVAACSVKVVCYPAHTLRKATEAWDRQVGAHDPSTGLDKDAVDDVDVQ